MHGVASCSERHRDSPRNWLIAKQAAWTSCSFAPSACSAWPFWSRSRRGGCASPIPSASSSPGRHGGILGALTLVDGGGVGRVMQIENDYDKEVYNGDIGYVGDSRARPIWRWP